MNLETANVIAILIGVFGTLIAAIFSARASSKQTQFEGARTELDLKRFERESNYDQAIQAAQTVNIMGTSLLQYYQDRVMELEQRNSQLETEHDHSATQGIELKMTMRNIKRLVDGLSRLDNLDMPNGCRDRLIRLSQISQEIEDRGLTQ